MTLEDVERVRKAVIRRYPISAGLALDGLDIELDDKISTAAVVGKKNDEGIIEVEKMKVSPSFLERLSFSERVFVLAHESLHIAFKHFARAASKPEADIKRKYEEYCKTEPSEEKRKLMEAVLHSRYHKMWNIATDACINAFLKKDGFSFPTDVTDPKTGEKMQFVELEDGFIKSAEKIYDYLVKKEEERQEEKKKEQEKNKDKDNSSNSNNNSDNSNSDTDNNGDNGGMGDDDSKGEGDSSLSNNPSPSKGDLSDLDDIDIDNFNGFDSHEEWTGNESDDKKETSKDSESAEGKDSTDSESENGKDSSTGESEKQKDESIDEAKIFEKEIENRKSQKSFETENVKESLSRLRAKNGLADFVPFEPVLSWKRLLVGMEEKTVEVWGNRRASRFNPNARIEERTEETRPSVEIILDVSGSVSTDLLRGFLLQLYPILETIYEDEVTMKVGTFSDYFSGFTDLRTKKDIADYRPLIGGGTNFELAATSFTPDPGRRITKIVFTDGVLGTKQKTRVPDIIWIVFGDKMNFTPVGGRIIHVSDEDYKEMINTSLLYDEEIIDKGYTK